MKIYFSGSIRGGRKYLESYKKIIQYLKSKGHIVLTERIASDNIYELEAKLTSISIYERDIQLLNECDVVIAEVSNPSLGVGYEISYALHYLEKPTLCLYQKEVVVSCMITGNTSHSIKLEEYENDEQLFSLIANFLEKL